MENIKDIERTLKAMANKRRLSILRMLRKNGETTVGEIAGELRLSIKATSKHLAILSSVDIVNREQRGLRAYYHLTSLRAQSPAARAILSLF